MKFLIHKSLFDEKFDEKETACELREKKKFIDEKQIIHRKHRPHSS